MLITVITGRLPTLFFYLIFHCMVSQQSFHVKIHLASQKYKENLFSNFENELEKKNFFFQNSMKLYGILAINYARLRSSISN